MSGKSLSLNRIRLAQAATGISPADFPLGSLESRVTARALLDRAERMKPPLAEHDRDALTIYGGTVMLTARMSPNYQDVEATGVYRHGKEISDSQAANEEPRHTGPGTGGDLLAKAGVTREEHCCWRLAQFANAWQRQLPHLLFPIKVENERVYFHQWEGEWKEETGFHADLILGRLSVESSGQE